MLLSKALRTELIFARHMISLRTVTARFTSKSDNVGFERCISIWRRDVSLWDSQRHREGILFAHERVGRSVAVYKWGEVRDDDTVAMSQMIQKSILEDVEAPKDSHRRAETKIPFECECSYVHLIALRWVPIKHSQKRLIWSDQPRLSAQYPLNHFIVLCVPSVCNGITRRWLLLRVPYYEQRYQLSATFSSLAEVSGGKTRTKGRRADGTSRT